MKTTFYPLRTIVGPSIPVKQIKILRQGNLRVETRQHANADGTPEDPIYARYLPDIVKDGTTYHPMSGMATMPIPNSNLLQLDQISEPSPLLTLFQNPSDVPFPVTDPVMSVFGYRDFELTELVLDPETPPDQGVTPFHSGRDLAIALLIQLERAALVGGICFNGYPFISSRIENTSEGMTLGNFGLPREIGLTPLPAVPTDKSADEFLGFHRTQFIDSEYAYTRQEILSHSGLNYLTIDPVKTDLLMLTFRDLPFITRLIDLDSNRDNVDNPLLIKGFKGFAIPYLYFFEYKEQSKRPGRLHAGLLGAKTKPYEVLNNQPVSRVYALKWAFPEYEYCFLEWLDVTGTITDSTGAALPNVTVRIRRTGQQAVTDDFGRFKLTRVNRNDVLDISALGFDDFEVPVDGRTIIRIKLPRGNKGTYSDSEQTGGVYCVFTAHSALGQFRRFPYTADLNYSGTTNKVLDLIDREKVFRECFVSDQLRANESVVLYLQQGEELDRCVAGFKAFFVMVPPDRDTENLAQVIANTFGVGVLDDRLSAEERTFVEDLLAVNLSLPTDTDFCEKIGLRVFELDPPEGVSPASVALGSKYSTLLTDITIDDSTEVALSQAIRGIPFRRTSSAKYFAVELTNRGTANGQLVIRSLQMMRSAHAAIHPRAVRTRQVKALHYRLIGPELADDFSRLGGEGFNFSIDRLVAGQPKSVFYSATSLLDLLHTGNARIQSNIRRPAAEFEMVQSFRETDDRPTGEDYRVKKFDGDMLFRPNQDNRTSTGWRKMETGDGVEWDFDEINKPGTAFETYGTNENRTHSTLLFPDTNNVDWLAIATLGNMLKLSADPLVGIQAIRDNLSDGVSSLTDFFDSLNTQMLINRYEASAGDPNNPDQLVKDFDFWRGISTNNANLRVRGIVSSSQSPVSFVQLSGTSLTRLLNALDELPRRISAIQSVLANPNPSTIAALFENLSDFVRVASQIMSPFAGPAIPILNGMSSGITTGVGLNINSGPNAVFPSYQLTANSGSTGSINKSANKTGYSYSQTLNRGFENSQLGENELKRIITRRELSGRDKQRVRGAEIMWQDKIQDIITGTIPLNFTLPATAARLHFRTADDTLRVRFNSGFASSVEVDFWFEVVEETIRDDY
jgi:hypothetical protein